MLELQHTILQDIIMGPNKDQLIVKVSFEEVLELCQELVDKIGFNSWHLWGVPRNGSIVAGLMTHCGNGQIQGLRLSPPFSNSFVQNSTLVVDDVHNSGKTLTSYAMRGMKTASLFWRKKDGHKPNFWVKTIEDDSWLVFPWEQTEKVISLDATTLI